MFYQQMGFSLSSCTSINILGRSVELEYRIQLDHMDFFYAGSLLEYGDFIYIVHMGILYKYPLFLEFCQMEQILHMFHLCHCFHLRHLPVGNILERQVADVLGGSNDADGTDGESVPSDGIPEYVSIYRKCLYVLNLTFLCIQSSHLCRNLYVVNWYVVFRFYRAS